MVIIIIKPIKGGINIMICGFEWKTEGISLDPKQIIQESLLFGGTEHSEFLDMGKNQKCSFKLPNVLPSHHFHVELDEIDF